tara:strand:+ start:1755 stop:2753 length:999 start_codon:yes stop_codon:yes gene_type:complete
MKISNGLFQRPTGGFFIRKTVNGKRRFVSLQGITTEEGARHCAVMCDMAIVEGRFEEFAAKFERKKPVSFDEAMRHWLLSASTIKKNKPKVVTAKKRTAISIKPFVSKMLGSITQPQLEEWVAYRNTEVNETTVFDDVARIRQFFAFCVDKEWIEKSPARKLQCPKPSRQTKDSAHVVTEEQIDAMCLSPLVALMVRSMWDTALRISELYRVQLADVHETMLHVRCDPDERTKSARGRQVPITAASNARLKRLALADLPGVHTVRREMAKESQRLGIVPLVTPHALRHSRASIWADKHCSLVQIQNWLGHSDQRTTQRYIHALPPRRKYDTA